MKRLIHLRLLLPVVSLALLALSVGLASYAARELEHVRTQRAVVELARDRLNQLQISAELFLQLGLRDQLQQLVASVVAEPDLKRVLIVGADDRVIAANRFALVGEHWHRAAGDLDAAEIAAAKAIHAVRTKVDPEQRFVDSYAAVCSNSDPSALRALDCGFVSYRIDLQYHYAMTERALAKQTAYFGTGVLTMSLVLLLALHLLVTRRANRIVAALRAFNGGARNARIPEGWHDEIGYVGRTVNQVLDQVEHQEHALVDQRERLRAVFDTVADGIITIDSRGIIQSANPATERLFGYGPGELLGQNVSVLAPMPVRDEHDRYIERYLETGEPRVIGTGREVEAVTKSGEKFAAELSVSDMTIGGQRMFTGVVRDVSERVRMRKSMEQVNAELVSTNLALLQTAKTDSLTGLANRSHFDATLQAEIRRAVRQDVPISLVLLDLDYFKRYNDHYGHYEGDKCLKAVARALAETCQRSGELPARYGGEEFAVILPGLDANRAAAEAERIRAAVETLQLPHVQSRTSSSVTASVGVATHVPQHGTPIADWQLIKAADAALYRAKAAGRNCVRRATAKSEEQAPEREE